jgi:poly(A) polymerase
MALVIRNGRLGGDLLDPHGGREDLRHRRLRFLHPHSVRDDPTRILRGARYACRLGFAMEPASLAQIRRTIAAWPWRWRPGDAPAQAPPALGTRLRMELQLLLERENGERALAILREWGALELLDRALQRDHGWRRRLRWARRLGVDPLVALLAGARDPLAVAERLQIPHRQHRLLARYLWLREQLERLEPPPSGGDRSPSDWCRLLEAPGVAAEAVALALAASVGPRRPLLRWWARWRHLRPPVTAEALMARGMTPGPALGQRLRQLRVEQLDRERR